MRGWGADAIARTRLLRDYEDPEEDPINLRLGNFKYEFMARPLNLVGPKTYQVLNEDGSVTTKCAGLPRELKDGMGFGDLKRDMKIRSFRRQRDPDSWVLVPEPTTYEITCKPWLLKEEDKDELIWRTKS